MIALSNPAGLVGLGVGRMHAFMNVGVDVMHAAD
jgi:hypothetical protein